MQKPALLKIYIPDSTGDAAIAAAIQLYGLITVLQQPGHTIRGDRLNGRDAFSKLISGIYIFFTHCF